MRNPTACTWKNRAIGDYCSYAYARLVQCILYNFNVGIDFSLRPSPLRSIAPEVRRDEEEALDGLNRRSLATETS